MIFLPEIFILPPIFFRKEIKSIISGSIAQFVSSVFPLAPKAASKAFSVAPTDTEGNFTFAPVKPF